MAGKATRKELPMNRLTPAEARRQGRQDAVQRRERESLEALRRSQLRAVRTRAYRHLADALRSFTVVLFLPHALGDDGDLPTIAETLKERWRELGFGVMRAVTVNVTEALAEDIFWERRLPQHRELVESLRAGHSMALLIARLRPQHQPDPDDPGAQGDAPMQAEEEDEEEEEEEEELRLGQIEHIIAETIYGFYPGSPDASQISSRQDSSPSEFFSPVGPSTTDLGVVGDQFRMSTSSWARRSSTYPLGSGQHIFEHRDELEDDMRPPWAWGEAEDSFGSPTGHPDSHQEQELRPVVDSAAAMLLKRDRVTLPGIWTPLTPLSKAAALRALFRDVTEGIYEEEPIPPPPPTAAVIVFRAYKRKNAWKVVSDFPNEVLHYGFFTEDKLRLAHTMEQYEQLRVKEPRDRLVVAVKSTRSAPLLALAEVGATYLSPNASIAKRDLEEYFSASVREAAPRQLTDSLQSESASTAPEEVAFLPQEGLDRATSKPAIIEASERQQEKSSETPLNKVISLSRVTSMVRLSITEQEAINEIEPLEYVYENQSRSSALNQGFNGIKALGSKNKGSTIALKENPEMSLISVGFSSTEGLEAVQNESSSGLLETRKRTSYQRYSYSTNN